jgi:hypothetical protein
MGFSRRENVVGVNHETSIKRKLSNVSAIYALELPDWQSALLVIYESIIVKHKTVNC